MVLAAAPLVPPTRLPPGVPPAPWLVQIRVMMLDDQAPWEGSDQHTPVPYGYLTGMLDGQLGLADS